MAYWNISLQFGVSKLGKRPLICQVCHSVNHTTPIQISQIDYNAIMLHQFAACINWQPPDAPIKNEKLNCPRVSPYCFKSLPIHFQEEWMKYSSWWLFHEGPAPTVVLSRANLDLPLLVGHRRTCLFIWSVLGKSVESWNPMLGCENLKNIEMEWLLDIINSLFTPACLSPKNFWIFMGDHILY